MGVTAALFALDRIRVQSAGNLAIRVCWKGKENGENGKKVAHAMTWFLENRNKLFTTFTTDIKCLTYRDVAP
jgi:hypothetical protein